MTIDHSADFDARRIGWWQRRSAVRRIRRAAAVTDADRDLRVQQAWAAQTRGEIHALTRGLDGLPAGATGRDAPPPTPRVPAPAPVPPIRSSSSGVPQPPGYAAGSPSAQLRPEPATPKRYNGARLLVGLVVGVFAFGGIAVSCVSSLVDSVSRGSPSSAPISVPDLGTEDGWNAMLEAFGDEADLSSTIGLYARGRTATLSVEKGETAASRYSYDGDVTTASEVQRLPSEVAFDLTEVDASVVVETVARARRASGTTNSTDAWVQVTAAGRGPQIYVTFPDGTYSLLVDADGGVVYETP